MVIYSKYHRNPFRGFGDPGVKIWPFPLLRLFAFTTACTTVQAVMTVDAVSYFDELQTTLAVYVTKLCNSKIVQQVTVTVNIKIVVIA